MHVGQSVVRDWVLHLFHLHLFHWRLPFVEIVYLKYKIIELIDLFALMRNVQGECKVTNTIDCCPLSLTAKVMKICTPWKMENQNILHFLLMHGLTTIFLV